LPKQIIKLSSTFLFSLTLLLKEEITEET
jgi:hypothetical protein